MNSPEQLDAVRSLIAGELKNIYRPRLADNVWQWAQKNVFLDAEMSPAHPGFYDLSLTPYQSIVQEFATDQYTNVEFSGSGRPRFDECFVMKASQLGLTEAVLNIIRYNAVNAPKHTAYVIDSISEAKKMSKIRLLPSLKKLAVNAQFLTDNEDDLGNLTMYLVGMVLHMLGSFSAGALSNKPLGLIILDELDKHKSNPNASVDTVSLARGRLKTTNGKIIALSTPETDKHILNREYLTGTQHKLFVPCPLCAERQVLIMEQLRFGHCRDLAGEFDLHRVLEDTYYECFYCHERVDERHKSRMVADGVWRQTNEKAVPRKMSVHISDLYSPFISWGELAVKFIAAQRGGDAKLRDFRNNHLAIPWKQERAEVTGNDVLRLRGAYKRGQCPFSPVLVTMCVDKQEDVFKYTKAGFSASGEMAVIDYGYTLVDLELLDRAKEPVSVSGSDEKVEVRMGLIDEGYKTMEVRDFVAETGEFFNASKGRGGIQVKQVVYESKVPHRDQYLTIYHYDDDSFKKQLYIQRIARFEKIVSGESRVPRLWLPADIEPHFVSELVAERLEEEKNTDGYTRYVWKMKSGEGDLVLDTFFGSGTVGEAALNLKRNFIGFELQEKYCEIADRRIAVRSVLRAVNFDFIDDGTELNQGASTI